MDMLNHALNFVMLVEHAENFIPGIHCLQCRAPMFFCHALPDNFFSVCDCPGRVVYAPGGGSIYPEFVDEPDIL